MSNVQGLIKSLGEERVRQHEPMSNHTSLGIGGPADWYYEAQDSGELIKAVRLARSFGVPLTIIGGGSNVLVSDLGIRGLVVKNGGGKLEVRTNNLGEVEVEIDSGVNLQEWIDKTLEKEITGLEWFSGIPGTVGGAVFNNIHEENHNFNQLVSDVVVLTKSGDVEKIKKYNQEGVVLEVILKLSKGNIERAREVALERFTKKSRLPKRSSGNVFKNIGEEESMILGYPTTAISYLVEHVLNMTGYRVGGAMIHPEYHNYIVNVGGATAKDFLAVRDEVVKRAIEAVGIVLIDKVVCLGDFNY